jgi:hypothetical protein
VAALQQTCCPRQGRFGIAHLSPECHERKPLLAGFVLAALIAIVGGGLEWGFGAWSLKGEYLYYDLGGHTLTAACSTVIGGCTGLAPTSFSTRFRDNGSIARVGLNYRF